jgi:hypothetical protein
MKTKRFSRLSLGFLPLFIQNSNFEWKIVNRSVFLVYRLVFLVYCLIFLVIYFSKSLKIWIFGIVTDQFLINRINRTGLFLSVFTIAEWFLLFYCLFVKVFSAPFYLFNFVFYCLFFFFNLIFYRYLLFPFFFSLILFLFFTPNFISSLPNNYKKHCGRECMSHSLVNLQI